MELTASRLPSATVSSEYIFVSPRNRNFVCVSISYSVGRTRISTINCKMISRSRDNLASRSCRHHMMHVVPRYRMGGFHELPYGKRSRTRVILLALIRAVLTTLDACHAQRGLAFLLTNHPLDFLKGSPLQFLLGYVFVC